MRLVGTVAKLYTMEVVGEKEQRWIIVDITWTFCPDGRIGGVMCLTGLRRSYSMQ